jgi:probable rRNA maturation factor
MEHIDDFFNAFFDENEEPEEGISFYAEGIDFELATEGDLIAWMEAVIAREKCVLNFINFIFCTDEYLLEINQEYLQHDTLTDIITFPYQDPPTVEGDIYISIERVRENASTYGVSFERELQRVMIHGVLHLCGFGDKTAEEKTAMTAKEDESLALLG